MKMSRIILFALLFLPFPLAADGLPLFDSNETLHLTIEAPMRTLIRDAADRPLGRVLVGRDSGEDPAEGVVADLRGGRPWRAHGQR